jgi:hypothetical protein
MRTLRSFAALTVGIGAGLASTACGGGGGADGRALTEAERGAITAALPEYIRDIPAGCVWLEERISDDGIYAIATPRFLPGTKPESRCIRFASNGFFVLKKAPRWQVVYNGSDPPPSSLGVPGDLLRDEGSG